MTVLFLFLIFVIHLLLKLIAYCSVYTFFLIVFTLFQKSLSLNFPNKFFKEILASICVFIWIILRIFTFFSDQE